MCGLKKIFLSCPENNSLLRVIFQSVAKDRVGAYIQQIIFIESIVSCCNSILCPIESAILALVKTGLKELKTGKNP